VTIVQLDRKQHTGKGFGQSGYCKVCDTRIVGEANGRLKAGQTVAMVQRWAESKGVKMHRTTWYRHVEHMKSGRDKVVQAARTVREVDKMTRVTNTEFLEAVRDLGYQNAQTNPESVNLNHALKAVQIMETTKDKGRDVLVILARAMTGNDITPMLPPPVEEGEYEELE
jgi:hypothetical protein